MINLIVKIFSAFFGISPDWDTDEYQSQYCQEDEE